MLRIYSSNVISSTWSASSSSLSSTTAADPIRPLKCQTLGGHHHHQQQQHQHYFLNRSNSFFLGTNQVVRTTQAGNVSRQMSLAGSIDRNNNNNNKARFDPRNVQKIVLEWCQMRTANYSVSLYRCV